MMRWLLTTLVLLIPAGAHAQSLTLDEVLRSSAAHAPAILEAMTRERQADGRRLTAEGAFDVVFEGDAQSRLRGYYNGSYVEGRVNRPLTTNGGGLYAGYRVSRGDFPVYYDENYTNRLGEFKIGAIFSLMRDRFVDERRTRLGLATQDIDIARLEREMVAIGVQRRAIGAYQTWVGAGMRVAVYRDLLALASERQESIERQIALGARPALLGVENRQNIVRRRTLLVRAEQELASAANALSFFLRDSDGAPVTPASSRLPAQFPALRLPPISDARERAINRPDLDAILVRLDQATARQRLAENDLMPRLDVRGEVSQDVGPVGSGGISRRPTEAVVGVRFSLPLERRAARGRIADAMAEADGLRRRRQLVEDQILVEVNGLAIDVTAADVLLSLSGDETALAARMADAERRRFQLGASDFLVVNLREEAAADARLRQVEAELRRANARAELVAATVDREQLGL
jgi:outer membrane protein TolC